MNSPMSMGLGMNASGGLRALLKDGQLDPEGFALVDAVVRELKGRGVTVLIATHQLERGGAGG